MSFWLCNFYQQLLTKTSLNTNTSSGTVVLVGNMATLVQFLHRGDFMMMRTPLKCGYRLALSPCHVLVNISEMFCCSSYKLALPTKFTSKSLYIWIDFNSAKKILKILHFLISLKLFKA